MFVINIALLQRRFNIGIIIFFHLYFKCFSTNVCIWHSRIFTTEDWKYQRYRALKWSIKFLWNVFFARIPIQWKQKASFTTGSRLKLLLHTEIPMQTHMKLRPGVPRSITEMNPEYQYYELASLGYEIPQERFAGLILGTVLRDCFLHE